MLDYFGVEKTQTPKLNHLPNVSSLLKISLGLIFFTLLSTALVYAETISVDIEGTSYDIDYTSEQVIVKSIIAEYEPTQDYAGLIIEVEVTGDSGTLDFVFDRSFFDSTFDGLDDEFFVVADGDFTDFSETETTSQSRSLSIGVPAGTLDIEIVGTVFNPTPITVDDSAAEEAAIKAAEEAAIKAAEEAAIKAAEEAAIKAAEEAAIKAAEDKVSAVTNPNPTQCGPGTILKDGACILDERCGPGTILKDGVCILDSTYQPTTTSVKGLGKDLMMGLIAAIAIAGVVGIILGILAKASKSND